MDEVLGAIIQSGMGLAGGIGANIGNITQARKQRDWQYQMLQDQRQYDLNMWNRTNQYNSPQSQMSRFKDAGLNPHLIYGKGSPGLASPLKSPDIKPYSRAENRNIADGVSTFSDMYQFKNIQAQTDNVKAQTEVANQQASIMKVKKIAEILGVLKKDFDFKMDQQYTPETKQTMLNKLKAEADLTGVKVETERLLKNPRVKEINKKIENLVKTGEILDSQNKIEQYKADLVKEGIVSGEGAAAMLVRMVVQAINKSLFGAFELGKDFDEFLQDRKDGSNLTPILK